MLHQLINQITTSSIALDCEQVPKEWLRTQYGIDSFAGKDWHADFIS